MRAMQSQLELPVDADHRGRYPAVVHLLKGAFRRVGEAFGLRSVGHCEFVEHCSVWPPADTGHHEWRIVLLGRREPGLTRIRQSRTWVARTFECRSGLGGFVVAVMVTAGHTGHRGIGRATYPGARSRTSGGAKPRLLQALWIAARLDSGGRHRGQRHRRCPTGRTTSSGATATAFAACSLFCVERVAV